jgi:hypothetical protein
MRLDKIYLDNLNRLVFPFREIRDIHGGYTMQCYHTIYPIGDYRIPDIMKMEYLQMDGTNSYNDVESVIEELTPSSDLYIKNKDFIEKVKDLLKESLYEDFYLNAIIFPRSIFDADI